MREPGYNFLPAASNSPPVTLSPWYRLVFPTTRIGPYKNSETEIELTARGFRLATTSPRQSRLIVVSNRVAVPATPRAPTAEGMAVAVKAALKNRSAVWFGWSGEVAEAAKAETRTIRVNKVDYVAFDLTSADIQEYYSVFAKHVLWPLLHYRFDLQQYSRLDASGYLRVNRLFPDRLNPLLKDDDVVWVHDYHLMPFGARTALVRAPQRHRILPSRPMLSAGRSRVAAP